MSSGLIDRLRSLGTIWRRSSTRPARKGKTKNNKKDKTVSHKMRSELKGQSTVPSAQEDWAPELGLLSEEEHQDQGIRDSITRARLPMSTVPPSTTLGTLQAWQDHLAVARVRVCLEVRPSSLTTKTTSQSNTRNGGAHHFSLARDRICSRPTRAELCDQQTFEIHSVSWALQSLTNEYFGDLHWQWSWPRTWMRGQRRKKSKRRRERR